MLSRRVRGADAGDIMPLTRIVAPARAHMQPFFRDCESRLFHELVMVRFAVVTFNFLAEAARGRLAHAEPNASRADSRFKPPTSPGSVRSVH